ncbi:MAG: hypothetical protein U9O87_03185 [Verrucomicrobiota bacterium]|nr:hypothetical protein [Verrucomicrobiota bacterium]
MKKNDHENLIKELMEKYRVIIAENRELILADLLRTSQIPSPTFHEQKRAQFMKDRFIQNEFTSPYIDDYGNVCAHIKGRLSEKKILICASIDSPFRADIDHYVQIEKDKASGVGIADNATAAATLVSLPEIIEKCGIRYDSDIIFLGTTESHGRGDMNGMREFVRHMDSPPDYVINLMSTQLGRIDHFCRSVVRCDIECNLEDMEEDFWKHALHTNANNIITELVDHLLGIPLPSKPSTTLNIGIISGGKSYTEPSLKAEVHIGVKSEKNSLVNQVIEDIKDCCADVGARYGIKLKLNFFGRQHAGGLHFSHPMVKNAACIVKQLDYEPSVATSNTQMSVTSSKGIPSLTLGITTGKRIRHKNAHVNLSPIADGITQILILLDLIEKGYCDEKTK